MNWNAKTLWPSAALSLIAGSSLLSANDDARSRNLENRVTALENRNNCCAVVNPSARPFSKDCWGFYIAGDAFIWQANANGMPIAVQTNGSTSFDNTSGENQVRNLHFSWDWGFRLTGGLNFDYDGWDSCLTWTRWHTDANRHLSAPVSSALYPSQGDAKTLNVITASNSNAHWKLHLNQLDWELGREFYVSKYLTLRPFAGFRSAWINQKLTTNYKELTGAPTGVSELEFKAKNNYWGLGILGGVDTQWGLGCGWSIFANYSASLLYGFVKVDADGYDYNAVDIRSIVNRTDNFQHLDRAITDMQIGLRYDWLSCDECFHFGIEAGWEHHMFWGQNQMLNFVDDVARGKLVTNQGDLAAQGYFVRVRFDF